MIEAGNKDPDSATRKASMEELRKRLQDLLDQITHVMVRL